MNIIDKLIREQSEEFAAKIRATFSSEQRLLDCESVCRDLNDAAKELNIPFSASTLVTVHSNNCAIAAYSCDRVTLAQVSEILDTAGHLYRIETPEHYLNEGMAIAFGIAGFQDQLVIADPKHIDLITVAEAERLAA